MDVSGVGATRPPSTEFSNAPNAQEGSKRQALGTRENVAQSVDTIAATLRQLSDIAALRLPIERPLSPENAVRLEALLRASISAVAERNVQQALIHLAEFAELDPRRAEILKSEPGLASIRPDVEQLLFRLTAAARLNAESWLERATRLLGGSVPDREAGSRLGQGAHFLEATGIRDSLGKEFTLPTAVLIAARLLEAGGYANSMCAAALTQLAMIQSGFTPPPGLPSRVERKSSPIPPAGADSDLPRKWLARIKKLWLRAPLLVLLLAWFGIGLVAGSVSTILRSYGPPDALEPPVSWAFEIWGVGFLALVALGFYASVRGKR